MKKCTEESENVPLSLLTHTAINVVAEAQQWGKTAFTLAAIFKQATSRGNLCSWALGTLGQNLAQTFSFLLPGSQYAYFMLCTDPAWQHTQLSTKSLYVGVGVTQNGMRCSLNTGCAKGFRGVLIICFSAAASQVKGRQIYQNLPQRNASWLQGYRFQEKSPKF